MMIFDENEQYPAYFTQAIQLLREQESKKARRLKYLDAVELSSLPLAVFLARKFNQDIFLDVNKAVKFSFKDALKKELFRNIGKLELENLFIDQRIFDKKLSLTGKPDIFDRKEKILYGLKIFESEDLKKWTRELNIHNYLLDNEAKKIVVWHYENNSINILDIEVWTRPRIKSFVREQRNRILEMAFLTDEKNAKLLDCQGKGTHCNDCFAGKFCKFFYEKAIDK